MAFPVWREEVPLRWQGVLTVPVCIAGAHDIAARRVNAEGRVQGRPQREKLLQQRVPFLRSGSGNELPLPCDLAETMLLVVVVHVDGPRLHVVGFVHGLEQAIVVGDRVQADASGIDCVHLRDTHLVQVCRRAHAVLLRFVNQRAHDFGTMRAEFQSVCAFSLCVAHPLAGFRRCQNLTVFVFLPGAHTLIGIDPGCHNLVTRTALFFCNGKLKTAARDAANCRDAMPHPQLVAVLRARRLGRAAGVRMHVDYARHDPLAVRIDFTSGAVGAVVFLDSQPRVTHGLDLDDAIVLDDDVHRAARRCAGAVDDSGAANNETRERAFTFIGVAIGCRDHGRGIRLCERVGEQQRQQAGQQPVGPRSFHASPPGACCCSTGGQP